MINGNKEIDNKDHLINNSNNNIKEITEEMIILIKQLNHFLQKIFQLRK